MFADDDAPRRRTAHEIGQDLAMISVEELQARVALLREEIARIEAEIARKAASRAAADQAFKL